MTEGGTGGHDWPAPVRDGLGIALHNSLVYGNASAFVPWQISEGRPSTHNIAVRDQVTAKTAAGMQYFRTIPPGSVRIDAVPDADGDLRVSAYRTPAGKLVVVALNTGGRAESLTVRVQGASAPQAWEVRRTNATDRFASQPRLAARGGTATLELGAHSIVTLVQP
jgi:O-glycosyl hydrolase